jgi:hypothetical protein
VTDHEQAAFEAELRRVRLAKPPKKLMLRLHASRPPEQARFSEVHRSGPPISDLLKLLRWLTPAAAALVLVAAVIWRSERPSTSRTEAATKDSDRSQTGNAPTALKADNVRIDQALVSSFDAVARLPSGEPVRFRCQKWMDQVAFSDKAQGFVITNRTPRFEVVAVGFETY